MSLRFLQREQSFRHLEKALRELAKQGGQQQKAEGSPPQNSRGTPEPPQSKAQQNARHTPAPGSMQKQENRKGAEQMLEMMGEDDKKMRSAIKQRQRMSRPQTERDW